MKKPIAALVAATAAFSLALAAPPAERRGTLPTASPEIYDSLLSTYTTSFEAFFRDFIDLDSAVTDMRDALPDSVYMARLEKMVSPIHLPYNDIVKKYIVTYTSARSTLMARILGLSQYYFPMIEQELANAGLPLELRMLPVIESALSPTAVSRVGATGLWQFMYGTGKNYGLEIT